jgi:nitrogen fixation protein FixH
MTLLADTGRRSGYRWFPWAIAASMAMVVAVNVALAYFAVTSSTGLVTEHPFEAGTGYNAVLSEAAAEDALGWHAKLAVSSSAGSSRHLEVRLHDRAGAPLDGATVTARLERPVEPVPPVPASLTESASGSYGVDLPALRPGQWEVRLVVRRGAELYQYAERIVLR